jgi:photosystem II stability/assembly factor-like uncharacterized protein
MRTSKGTATGAIAAAVLGALLVVTTPAASSTSTDFRGASRARTSARESSPPSRPETIEWLSFDPHDSNTIWAVLDGDSALYRSDDGAQTWRRVNVLPQREEIGEFGIDESGQQLYVGVLFATRGPTFRAGNELWQSLDRGATWHRLVAWPKRIAPIGMRHTAPGLVDGIAVDPSRSETVYASTHGVVLRSLDSGQSWVRMSRGLPKLGEELCPRCRPIASKLVVDPVHPDVLYFLSPNRGVYRSVNAGGRWVPARRGLVDKSGAIPQFDPQLAQLTVDPSRPSRLYVAQAGRIWRTTNSGQRWRVTHVTGTSAAGPPDVAVARDGTVYAADGSIVGRHDLGLVRSDDGGGKWTRLELPPLTRPQGKSNREFDAELGPLAVNPENANVVLTAVFWNNSYTGDTCVRLLKTTDRGHSWKRSDNGLIAPGGGCRIG